MNNPLDTLVVPPSTLKRLLKELNDLSKSPLAGASVCMPNHNDPLTLHANILIMEGPYKDLLVHMLIHIPQDYPIIPPTINLAPGLNFGKKYHGRLFDDPLNGVQVCSNLLKGSGWSPSYTLRSVLLQLQVLFSDLDDYEPQPLTKEEVEELKKHVREFKTTIVLSDNKVVTHSWESPYPALPSSTTDKKQSPLTIKNANPDEVRKNAEEWLYCALSESSFFDKDRPVLGYPLDIRTDEFGSCWTTPVVEMISYDAFIEQVSSSPDKQKDYENIRFKSSFGDSYNFWIPVYINEEHWKAAYKRIRFAISVARIGFEDSNSKSFSPYMALKVLTGILNKIASQILQGKPEQTKAAIQAFSHFYHLLIRFILEYPELQQDIDELVDATKTIEESRSKQDISDIGEFFVKLSLSKLGLRNPSLNQAMLEEYLARQVAWVLKAEPKFLQQEWNLNSFVKAFIGQSRTSHQILAVLLETLKVVTNNSAIFNSDNGFSILPAKTVEALLKNVSLIRQTVAVNGDWQSLAASLSLDTSIRRDEDMAKVIQRAFEISAKQRYSFNTTIPSFQNSRKKYEEIPFNPNFNLNKTTVLSPTNLSASKSTSSNKSQTVSTKTSVIMSTATWADKKTELKGFEASQVIEVFIPIKKETDDSDDNDDDTHESKYKIGLFKKTGKYDEESKGKRNYDSKKGDYYSKNGDYYYKKGGANGTQIKKTRTNNSTAENSMSQDYDGSKRGSTKTDDAYFFFYNTVKTSNKLNSEVKGKPNTVKTSNKLNSEVKGKPNTEKPSNKLNSEAKGKPNAEKTNKKLNSEAKGKPNAEKPSNKLNSEAKEKPKATKVNAPKKSKSGFEVNYFEYNID